VDADVKNRLRLWLRSEKAFGLPSVHAAPPREASAESGASHIVIPDEAPDATATTCDALFTGASAAESTSTGVTVATDAGQLFTPDAAQIPFDAPPLSAEDKRGRLIAMDDKEVRGCTKCRLCETRTNTVFGEGDPAARIFFIGEGPGQTEDETGRPFVGRAGELLNKWIAAMGLAREQVYIANIVKCRPPANREPAPDEVATCTPYLQRQIEIIRPEVLITLGRPSTQYMLQSKLSMSRLRGQWQSWRGIKLMPTYHPAYILRSYTYETRSAVWSDLKKVMAELKLPLPKGGGPKSDAG
jgi:DNA polymerase